MIIGPGEAGGDPGPDRSRSVERLFDDLREGRREALDELFPLVYQELRELAHRQRQAWRGDTHASEPDRLKLRFKVTADAPFIARQAGNPHQRFEFSPQPVAHVGLLSDPCGRDA